MNAKIVSLVLTTAALFAAAAPAEAVHLTIGGTQVANEGFRSSVAGAHTITFNDGTAPTSGPVTYSGITDHIVQGSRASHHASPAGNTSRYLTLSTQTARGVAGNTGSLTINFKNAISYFGLYWGSVDTYNFLDIFSGGKLIRTISGRDVSTTARGSWTGASDNVYVNLFATNGQNFDKIVMRSTGIAFETDNHAYVEAVPEPLTLGGSALALGLVLRLRKRQKAAKQA